MCYTITGVLIAYSHTSISNPSKSSKIEQEKKTLWKNSEMSKYCCFLGKTLLIDPFSSQSLSLSGLIAHSFSWLQMPPTCCCYSPHHSSLLINDPLDISIGCLVELWRGILESPSPTCSFSDPPQLSALSLLKHPLCGRSQDSASPSFPPPSISRSWVVCAQRLSPSVHLSPSQQPPARSGHLYVSLG